MKSLLLVLGMILGIFLQAQELCDNGKMMMVTVKPTCSISIAISTVTSEGIRLHSNKPEVRANLLFIRMEKEVKACGKYWEGYKKRTICHFKEITATYRFGDCVDRKRRGNA